jgi:hypothetical protein
VTLESDSQKRKHFDFKQVVGAGMQIDESDEHSQKAEAWISDRWEPDSNSTEESDRHPEKHWWPRMVTDDGIRIDESDQQ